MAEWWNALALELQIFYGLGLLATLLLVIQLILTIFGAGDAADGGDFDLADGADGLDAADAGLDGGADAVHASGLQILSTRTVVAFVAGFGWTGAIAREGGVNLPLSVLSALVVGTLLMLLVFWLMRGLYSLRQSGTLDYRNAIGQVGTVYVTIPAARGGEGQIQVLVQGRLATVPAITDAAEPIPGGSKVKVTSCIAATTLKVESV